MDLSKIKLVVSDMDGTLLNSKGKVSDRFFDLYKKLKRFEIHFVAASGRQYHSISEKLSKIQNEIFIIAENGGVTKQSDRELDVAKMDSENISHIIQLLRTIEKTNIILCGKEYAYIETEDKSFVDMFQEYYPRFTIVKDLTKVTYDDLFKIAVYHNISSEEYIYPNINHLENELQIKVSSKNWVDISHPDANKGNALQIIQNKLGITKEETMVFGDYNNDLEMLSLADYSFAMENAHPNIKNAASYQTKSNEEEGVEIILEKLLTAKSNKEKHLKTISKE
ncbi:MAG: HAD family hydrolase [Bacteroidota bacterium]